jgi:hypothetical protein
MINSSLHGDVSARNEETQSRSKNFNQYQLHSLHSPRAVQPLLQSGCFGEREPNYTKIPNALMDRWIPELSGAELKVLLYLVRRTYGFHRDRVEAGLRRRFAWGPMRLRSTTLSECSAGTKDGLRRICHGIPGKDRGTGLHLESASKAVKCLESRGLLGLHGGKSTGPRTAEASYFHYPQSRFAWGPSKFLGKKGALGCA